MRVVVWLRSLWCTRADLEAERESVNEEARRLRKAVIDAARTHPCAAADVISRQWERRPNPRARRR